MNMFDQELGQKLKIKFGTPDLNEYQVRGIQRDIKALAATGVTPTDSDWAKIVKKYCPEAGSFIYKGADMADLTTLLQLATKK